MAMIRENFLILAFMLLVIGTWSTTFNYVEAKTPILTDKPTQLTATAVSPTQINLSWLAPTQNYGKIIVGYKIEQRLSNGAFYAIVENSGNTLTTYSLTGLQTGNTFTYRVSAVYSDDTTTDPSNSASATPIPSSSPPPTTPLSSPITNVKFDFVPPDGTTLSYVIVSQSDYLVLQYKKDARSIIIDANATSEAINNNLNGLLSYQNNHQSSSEVPAPLIAKSVSTTQINLSWLPPLESHGFVLAGYKIESKRSEGDYETIDDNTGNSTTRYYVTGLSPGKAYTYRVSAVYTSSTVSNPSNEASATTLTYTTPQQTPSPQQSNLSQSQTTQTVTPIPPQINNVKFDFTAPDGGNLSGVIMTQSDYQQFLIIKDPRTILSNVGQTSNTINNNLAGLLRYQEIHKIQEPVNPILTPLNSSKPPPEISTRPDNAVVNGVVTAIIASGVVSIITWLVRTKIAKKIAKEYNFTLEKFFDSGLSYIRIRNSGETIEDCIIICEKQTCTWTDTNVDKPRHVYEGSISSVRIPEGFENQNPHISIKSGKKTLRKTWLDDMAHG